MELYKKHISDLGRIVTGKTPRTSNAENYGGNIPFLTPSDDLSGKFAPQTVKTITEEGLSEVKNCLLPSKSVCVSCIGSDLGKVVITNEPTVTNQQFNSIIPTEENDTDFIYYLMTIVGKHLNFLSKTSTAVPIINKSTFADFEIEVPSLENQRRIAKILSSLDNKIEVNRRINDNLEQQAQALFKSWFVDFEPFRDQPFVESELGMIPEGWRVGTIGELCSLVSGFAFQSCTYVDKGLYRLVTIKNVQDGYLNSDGAVCLNEVPSRMPTHCLLKIGDILLSLTGNVGRCCFVNEERLLLNQRVAKIKPNKDSFWGYIYTFFRNEDIKTLLISIARGTAQANLSPVETLKLTTIVPANEAIEKFSKIVNSLYEEFIKNMIESHRLASLRDTLLPRLMSGEIKVGDVTL